MNNKQTLRFPLAVLIFSMLLTLPGCKSQGVPAAVSPSSEVKTPVLTVATPEPGVGAPTVTPAPSIDAPIPAATVLKLGKADINHDGQLEQLILTLVEPGVDNPVSGKQLCLQGLSDSEETLWTVQDFDGYSVASEDSIFLVTKDGEQYLLRYSPGGQTGLFWYGYTLLFIDSQGGTQVVDQDYAEVNLSNDATTELEPMTRLLEKVNVYLDQGTLLVSTTSFIQESFLSAQPLRLTDTADIASYYGRDVRYAIYATADHPVQYHEWVTNVDALDETTPLVNHIANKLRNALSDIEIEGNVFLYKGNPVID